MFQLNHISPFQCAGLTQQTQTSCFTPMLEHGDGMDSMAMESMWSRTLKPKTELPNKSRVFIASVTCGALQFILSRALFVLFVVLFNDFVKVCQPQVLTFLVCGILYTP
jgi:hypothetical protein